MKGAGKYDLQCSKARKSTKAKAAILIIIDGKEGSGISVQVNPNDVSKVAPILRNIADQMEKELE